MAALAMSTRLQEYFAARYIHDIPSFSSFSSSSTNMGPSTRRDAHSSLYISAGVADARRQSLLHTSPALWLIRLTIPSPYFLRPRSPSSPCPSTSSSPPSIFGFCGRSARRQTSHGTRVLGVRQGASGEEEEGTLAHLALQSMLANRPAYFSWQHPPLQTLPPERRSTCPRAIFIVYACFRAWSTVWLRLVGGGGRREREVWWTRRSAARGAPHLVSGVTRRGAAWEGRVSLIMLPLCCS
ncbi:hypothetical protein B0H19DRAFT_192217 [Mycena capillaripes]|nr:hypothetical protein B0H19DRAFT_192217 [Mycena capillaripes]